MDKKITHFKISEDGRKLVESGEMDFLHPLQILFLEIGYRIEKSISKENLMDMANAMFEEYGSFESAIEAIRDGRITFKQTKLH